MKNIFRIIISAFFILCFMFSSCQNKQDRDNNKQLMSDTFTSPESAALSSIHLLQTLVSNEKLKGVIDLTIDEVKQLQIGKAIPIIEVSYNKLVKSNSDSISTPPLDKSQKSKILYPLQINGATKTTALVYGNGDKWKLSTTGDNSLIELISMIKPNDGISNIDLIDIPGLSISFLKYTINQQSFYITNKSIIAEKIERGVPILERDALRLISKYARDFDKKYGKEIRKKKFVD